MDDVTMTREEVQEELKKRGIDVTRVVSQVLQAVRERRMNKSRWLRCSISPGQFKHEFAVSGATADGKGFSLFLPEDLIETDTEGEPIGWIQVVEVGRNENMDQALVRLPRPAELGSMITVRVKDLR